MDKRKKIFILINSLEGGGAENVVINLCNNINNYNVYLITLKKSKFYDVHKNINLISLSNVSNNLLMFLLIPYYIIKFKKILRKYNITKGISFLEISNFINILSNKDAIISFRININFFKGFFGIIYKYLIRLLYPKSKNIIVNSEENKYSILDFLSLNKDRVNILYNPICIEKVKKDKVELINNNIIDSIKGKKIFITTGRLVWQKHHALIINSLIYIYDNIDKNWIYLIIGDGVKKNELENQVKKHNLSKNILFLGNQKNIFKYLNIADYFIYASEVEGFPNVLIEAMAMNLPIITSDFKTGAKEIIFGEYPSYDIKQYPAYGSNGCLLSLDNYQNDFIKVYKNLKKVGQNKLGFERFDINMVSKQFIEVINQ